MLSIFSLWKNILNNNHYLAGDRPYLWGDIWRLFWSLDESINGNEEHHYENNLDFLLLKLGRGIWVMPVFMSNIMVYSIDLER